MKKNDEMMNLVRKCLGILVRKCSSLSPIVLLHAHTKRTFSSNLDDGKRVVAVAVAARRRWCGSVPSICLWWEKKLFSDERERERGNENINFNQGYYMKILILTRGIIVISSTLPFLWSGSSFCSRNVRKKRAGLYEPGRVKIKED